MPSEEVEVAPARVLETFGRALLAIGLADAALQNFNGCRRLAEELGEHSCPGGSLIRIVPYMYN